MENIKIKVVNVSSKALDLSGSSGGGNFAIDIDNEIYVGISVFAPYMKVTDSAIVFLIGGIQETIPRSGDERMLTYEGRVFVKLSALDLAGTIEGETLDIK